MRSLYKSNADREIIDRWCRRRLDSWDLPHRRRTVDVKDARVHLTEIGEGLARFVLVPGTNFNAAASLDFAAVLGRRRPTVIVDLPGQPGLSSGRRPSAARLGWYADTLSRTLDAVDLSGVTAVGHSLGAAVVLSCDSERIEARALISPAGLTRLQVDARMMTRSLAWLLSPSTERARAMLEDFTAPGTPAPQAIVEWLTLVAAHCRSTLAPPPLPRSTLNLLRGTPLLAATGEYDRFLPPSRLAPAVSAALGVELHVIPGVGHLAVDEAPEAVADLVESLASR